MIFISFILGFFLGCAIMMAGVVLAMLDPRETKNLTKEKWKKGYRKRY